MYDWANSVYSLVITSSIFPAYFEAVTSGKKIAFLGRNFKEPTALYDYAVAVSFPEPFHNWREIGKPSRTMNVLIMSQYYDPEPIPKPSELAQGLLAQGHTPIVITGFPNYPTGEIYPGYVLRLFQHEIINSVSVTRVFEYPNHGTKTIGRIVNYVSFMMSAPLASFRGRKCDVIYVWHPPLTVGVAAWIISRRLNIPVVYDVQDIWPESVAASGLLSENGSIYHFLQRLERFVYQRMNQLIVVTEGAKQNLIGKGVPEQKITVLPHWVDETQFEAPTIEQQQAIIEELDKASYYIERNAHAKMLFHALTIKLYHIIADKSLFLVN